MTSLALIYVALSAIEANGDGMMMGETWLARALARLEARDASATSASIDGIDVDRALDAEARSDFDSYGEILRSWAIDGIGANDGLGARVANGANFRMPFGVVAVPKCYPNCVDSVNVARRAPARGWSSVRDEILRTAAVEETLARVRETLELLSMASAEDEASEGRGEMDFS